MAFDSEKRDVNAANCLAFADILENSPDLEFDMSSWHFCICGHINKVLGKSRFVHERVLEAPAEFLGIDISRAQQLFQPGKFYYTYSAKQAAKVLRHLAATGDVDWTVASMNHEN